MRKTLFLFLFIAGFSVFSFGQQPEKGAIRIVDSMTMQEKSNRNPVILRRELDSLIKLYSPPQTIQDVKEPVKDSAIPFAPVIWGIAGLITVMLVWLLFQFYSHKRKFNRVVRIMGRQMKNLTFPDTAVVSRSGGSTTTKETHDMPKEKGAKGKTSPAALESRIGELNDELHKLKKENEGLSRVLKEYNGIQHEFDSLRHGLTKAYKVRNYPGYEKGKAETAVLQGVLETESTVANYAYEKFLKPVLSIADSNKNNPATINKEDRTRVMELLISLSLYYIEYLYLRVNDLAIGGKMVERIEGLKKGNGLDPTLLKELNTEHGSRALVLKMILDKTDLHNLSYPVFDETNLNNP